MKRIFLIAVTSLTMLFSAATVQAQTDNMVPAIHVQGSAVVNQVPDAFSVTFIFEQKGPLVSKLNQQLEHDMGAVINFLMKAGVEEKHIQSMQITLNPWYEHTPNGREEKGFVLSREIRVIHNNLQDYDTIIDGVLSRGVKRIQQFDFIVTNQDDAYEKALINAVKDAKLRASRLAKELGVSIGQVLSVSESGRNYPVPVMKMAMAAESADRSLPGQQAISANVSVSFAIRQ